MGTPYAKEQRSHTSPWFNIMQDRLATADIAINGPRPFDICVNHPDFFKRVLQKGSLGLGESYMDGWWECERLDIFFHLVLRAGLKNTLPRRLRDLMRIAAARVTNLQSHRRARVVGERHYDLGNDLFALMLDPYMQYSCAYWKQAQTLECAQEDKLTLICEKLQLKPGMSLLDIGCGWGGLAEFAARRYGVSVYGITISREQQTLAQQRCQGLDVIIALQDYRDLDRQFDRAVSVGMFEHVGPRNYDNYFSVVRRNLKPDGLFLLHTIGGNKTASYSNDPWMHKYIFPHGCIPSIQHIAQASEPYMVMEDWHNFGTDYDRTLMAWHTRFQQGWPQLSTRYTARFRRMFSYYLNACAGAFRARDLQLWQVVFSINGIDGGLRVLR
ncbi:cyclopropane fatty acyl phospholipid synthase [Pectobacterium parmentieri]|uniref:Cyclopropane-fatty-acyl-phospholipid synthase n=1 Tax=Pectobacterium parmentieri TaxID=1905730 RepID=A0A8B3FCS5_PECPM|nr:cyclopropane fatty acyl phospholipid synthase [Pectobacterium parmentieri]AOR58321.1 cyclopropane-fatty-acyl-phospholipid synthase [Pectobacterium parmentieri]AYH10668.1 cyclopropane-fatty-acyl-phospholipid synthase [Pectobacterium parmentieri]AYH18621.1 cyclopropane-fatty-acyl-phospholipid synthase [Pectobacterium parmentieri]AYH36949.1 cyclopropane-fatty-acyl-phospholipid synthase [Pectobacterium parmentieri]AZS57181.1 cyclopropane-fatty-acyl-phospholipid synthase [Pectobacterium parmenti